MAEGNPSLVANHILRLLQSEDIKKVVPQELLQKVDSEISALRHMLLEAEKKRSHDDEFKWLILKIEDVLDDAENLLEGLSFVALILGLKSNTVKLSLGARLFPLISRPKKIRELYGIRERLKEILDEFRARRVFIYPNLEERNDRFQHADRRLVAQFYTDETDLVSRGDDKREIMSFLFNPTFERKLAVLPIVGMGGIGKTVLAAVVFNDERVKEHFETRIWVTVSQDFDIERISRHILKCLTYYEDMGNLEKEAVLNFVRDKIGGKRWLIVLDDVWNEDRLQWETLMSILPVGVMGSKMILTTRSQKVASIAGSIQPYHLGCLTPDQSWILFKKVAFHGEEPKQSYQKELGMEIVRKCGGLPLAITTIGGMLSTKGDSEPDWMRFCETEFSTLMRDNDVTLQILQLSYNNLPSYLKHCFAYCSLFPKDHVFDVQTMIKLWMAQGFVEPPVVGISLEEAGYQCFFDLLREGFFQDTEKDLRGRVTKFRVHDLMHDLAIFVAGKQCATLSSYTDRVDRRTSHVSFASGYLFSEEGIPDPLIHAGKMRSILMPSQLLKEDRSGRADKICKSIISRFRLLRTLDMHALGIKIVPNSIGKLILLKYLDLSENGDITELPDSITKLVNLQTLRLSSCFKLKKLPGDITNLVHLRHLETDGCYNLASLPPGIRRLPNLQTLPQLVVSEGDSSRSDELKELEVPNKLRDFEVKNLRHEDNMASYLNKIQGVQSLSLEWESRAPKSDNNAPLDSKLFTTLRELTLIGFWSETLFSPGFPSNLVRLCLSRWVKGKNLAPLKHCSNLKELVLHKITNLEYILNDVEIESVSSTTTPFFPFLEDLCLTELPNLQGWWKVRVNSENLPSFPHLSKLVIEDCPKLASMPIFPTLEEELVLDSTCLQPLLDTMKHKAKHSASSSTSEQPSPLAELKNLSIVEIDEFNNSVASKIQWNALKRLQKLKFDFLP